MQAPAHPSRARSRIAPAALGLSLALGIAACNGGGPFHRSESPPPTIAAADLGFLSQATYADLAAIDLGRMAEDQATDPAVRDMAGRLVDEHRDSVRELAAIADRRSVDVPDRLNAGRAAVDDRLSAISGPEFDAQYLQQQIADHEVSLALFRNEADRGSDAELRDFAQRWLPTLEHRADQLRAMSDRLEGMSGPPEPPAAEPPAMEAAPPQSPPAITPAPPPAEVTPEDLPPPGGDAGEPENGPAANAPPAVGPPPRIDVP